MTASSISTIEDSKGLAFAKLVSYNKPLGVNLKLFEVKFNSTLKKLLSVFILVDWYMLTICNKI